MASIYDKASLVLIPSGTKTSKVYSQKPTNGDGDFTFSRSTAATRVNASGNIEKETQNLLTYSNDFNNAPWTIASGNIVTDGQSGYDGTNNAWEIQAPSSNWILRRPNTQTGVQTFSVYVKKNATYGLRLYAFGTDNANVYYNLNTGVVVARDSDVIHDSITDVGNDWWRITMTYNQTNTQFYFYVTDNSNATINGGTLVIQDAQLEQGLVARDYIETTTTAIYGGITDNVPRLDYTDSSCPALLLEPQRTNLYSHSEYFEGWTKNNAVTTINATTSPEGLQNAIKLAGSAVNGEHTIYNIYNGSNVIHTYSAFYKAGEYSYAFLRAGGVSGGPYVIYDLTDQSLISSEAGTPSIESVGNDWYRISIIPNNSGATNALNAMFLPSSGYTLNGQNVPSFTGDGTSGGYFYGAQLEEGSYATSYIPTYGSAVTRNSDTTYKYNATSIVGDTEGVMFIDCVPPANDNPILMQLINNTSVYSQSIYFEYVRSINKIRCNAYDSGILQASFQLDAVIGNQYKIALAYKENDFAFYVNGSLIGTDTNASVQSGLQDILIGVLKGSFGSYNFIGNYVNQAMLFKTRLSNEELATLTTI